MILEILGILFGISFFFGGLYFCSRSGSWKAPLWALAAIVGLAMIASGVVTIVIPDFFYWLVVLDMEEILFGIYAFVLGASIGSFANVCIYRLPRNLAIAMPCSRCVKCGSQISWYDNLPVLSFVFLCGRCRYCASPFGISHFFVEILVGMVSLWIYQKLGIGFLSIYIFFLFVALLIVSVIDIEHRIIPDVISITGIWLGLFMAGVMAWLGSEWFVTFGESILGVLVGGGLLWGVGFLYERITKQEGIGFGDVKLLALFGAHSGISGVLTSLFFGSLLGSVAGIFLIVIGGKGRKTPIPFGPFLCLGLLFHALGGDNWLHSLLSLSL